MQFSPNLPVSAHPELVEGLFVKMGTPTMTPISPTPPVSQLQPWRQYPPGTR